MKILAIIIIYNANLNELCTNINSFIKNVDKVVLWQNSNITDKKHVINSTCMSEKIIFLGNGKNIGIGKAINIVITKYGQFYDYIMTMDQDSWWINFETYIDNVKFLVKKYKNVFAYGPQITTGYNKVIKSNERYVDHVITSGAIYDISILKNIGFFNEEYFIDAVDEEICYRAQECGYYTMQINQAFLKQKYGQQHVHLFLFKRIILPEYSAIRLYYIVRNHIILVRDYNINIKIKSKIIYRYILRPIFEVIIYGNDRKECLKKVCQGIFDAFNRIMGKRY